MISKIVAMPNSKYLGASPTPPNNSNSITYKAFPDVTPQIEALLEVPNTSEHTKDLIEAYFNLAVAMAHGQSVDLIPTPSMLAAIEKNTASPAPYRFGPLNQIGAIQAAIQFLPKLTFDSANSKYLRVNAQMYAAYAQSILNESYAPSILPDQLGKVFSTWSIFSQWSQGSLKAKANKIVEDTTCALDQWTSLRFESESTPTQKTDQPELDYVLMLESMFSLFGLFDNFYAESPTLGDYTILTGEADLGDTVSTTLIQKLDALCTTASYSLKSLESKSPEILVFSRKLFMLTNFLKMKSTDDTYKSYTEASFVTDLNAQWADIEKLKPSDPSADDTLYQEASQFMQLLELRLCAKTDTKIEDLKLTVTPSDAFSDLIENSPSTAKAYKFFGQILDKNPASSALGTPPSNYLNSASCYAKYVGLVPSDADGYNKLGSAMQGSGIAEVYINGVSTPYAAVANKAYLSGDQGLFIWYTPGEDGSLPLFSIHNTKQPDSDDDDSQYSSSIPEVLNITPNLLEDIASMAAEKNVAYDANSPSFVISFSATKQIVAHSLPDSSCMQGQHAFILAPSILVQDPVVSINTSGLNGYDALDPFQNLGNSNSPTGDISKGIEGKQGGDVLVLTQEITGGVLRINTSGGNGGDGQNGQEVLGSASAPSYTSQTYEPVWGSSGAEGGNAMPEGYLSIPGSDQLADNLYLLTETGQPGVGGISGFQSWKGTGSGSSLNFDLSKLNEQARAATGVSTFSPNTLSKNIWASVKGELKAIITSITSQSLTNYPAETAMQELLFCINALQEYSAICKLSEPETSPSTDDASTDPTTPTVTISGYLDPLIKLLQQYYKMNQKLLAEAKSSTTAITDIQLYNQCVQNLVADIQNATDAITKGTQNNQAAKGLSDLDHMLNQELVVIAGELAKSPLYNKQLADKLSASKKSVDDEAQSTINGIDAKTATINQEIDNLTKIHQLQQASEAFGKISGILSLGTTAMFEDPFGFMGGLANLGNADTQSQISSMQYDWQKKTLQENLDDLAAEKKAVETQIGQINQAVTDLKDKLGSNPPLSPIKLMQQILQSDPVNFEDQAQIVDTFFNSVNQFIQTIQASYPAGSDMAVEIDDYVDWLRNALDGLKRAQEIVVKRKTLQLIVNPVALPKDSKVPTETDPLIDGVRAYSLKIQLFSELSMLAKAYNCWSRSKTLPTSIPILSVEDMKTVADMYSSAITFELATAPREQVHCINVHSDKLVGKNGLSLFSQSGQLNTVGYFTLPVQIFDFFQNPQLIGVDVLYDNTQEAAHVSLTHSGTNNFRRVISNTPAKGLKDTPDSSTIQSYNLRPLTVDKIVHDNLVSEVPESDRGGNFLVDTEKRAQILYTPDTEWKIKLRSGTVTGGFTLVLRISHQKYLQPFSLVPVTPPSKSMPLAIESKMVGEDEDTELHPGSSLKEAIKDAITGQNPDSMSDDARIKLQYLQADLHKLADEIDSNKSYSIAELVTTLKGIRDNSTHSYSNEEINSILTKLDIKPPPTRPFRASTRGYVREGIKLGKNDSKAYDEAKMQSGQLFENFNDARSNAAEFFRRKSTNGGNFTDADYQNIDALIDSLAATRSDIRGTIDGLSAINKPRHVEFQLERNLQFMADYLTVKINRLNDLFPTKTTKKNLGTALSGDISVQMSGATKTITYEQDNGMKVTSVIEYSENPPTSSSGLVKMTVNFEGCQFTDTGRCIFTDPSRGAYKRKNNTTDSAGRFGLDSDNSAHLIQSEAGANAGARFGSSVTTSPVFNKVIMQRTYENDIKTHVGSDVFGATVTVEFGPFDGVDVGALIKESSTIIDGLATKGIDATKGGAFKIDPSNEDILKQRFDLIASKDASLRRITGLTWELRSDTKGPKTITADYLDPWLMVPARFASPNVTEKERSGSISDGYPKSLSGVNQSLFDMFE